jgi:negative regulator of sigma-B (phosphoserine phosphatase)
VVAATASTQHLVEVGMASRPHPRELLSGDAALVVPTQHGVLLAVADGLGHGAAASVAAELALSTVRERAGDDLEKVLGACHAILRHSRGCVISLALVADCEMTLRWSGVGNVDGVVRHASGGSRRFVSSPGIVGAGRWRPNSQVATFGRGDLLVMATDGIRADGLDLSDARGTPATLAASILAQHARENDDALVLVARRRGGPAGRGAGS